MRARHGADRTRRLNRNGAQGLVPDSVLDGHVLQLMHKFRGTSLTHIQPTYLIHRSYTFFLTQMTSMTSPSCPASRRLPAGLHPLPPPTRARLSPQPCRKPFPSDLSRPYRLIPPFHIHLHLSPLNPASSSRWPLTLQRGQTVTARACSPNPLPPPPAL
jgi:hypothetical protein